MASLIHEKSWDDIVVKEILARADVGRSTFYAHFSDKDALLLSALRDIVRGGHHADDAQRPADPAASVLAFSRPLLQHIERVRSSGRAPRSASGYAPLHARLRDALVELVEEELRLVPRSAVGEGRPALTADFVARQLASTFLLTLEWWIGLSTPIPACDADAVFRTLAGPAVNDLPARDDRTTYCAM